MTIMKGYMSNQTTVWCGFVEEDGAHCGQWTMEDEPSRARMAKKVKRLGWRLTRKHGWLCPRHK